MNKPFLRVAIFALFAGAGFASIAHELECEKKAGIVKLDAMGNPLLDATTGLPIFEVAPAAVLKIDAFPAAIGFRIGVRNLAADPSVVTSVSDSLLDAIASKTSFGIRIGPGLSLPVDGRAEQVVVVRVESQEQCLDLFKSGVVGNAPVCQNVVENRFLVRHDVGSAECRSQVICAAPPPPPVCDPDQHICGGQCVSNSSLNSCGASCTPCSAAPEHAHATCNGVACGFDCDEGFVHSNGACVAPPGPGPLPAPTCDGDTWSGVKKFGAPLAEDTGTAIALDALCNVHFTGTLGAAPVEGATDDAFLKSFDRMGMQYQSQQLSTDRNDQGRGVSTDAAGNRYVLWASFTFQPPSRSMQVTKFDAAGNSLWTTGIADPAVDTGVGGIVADAAGNTYAVGTTSGRGKDAFVTKLDALGTEVWTTPLGSTANDFAIAVALDQAGNVYVAGSTSGALGGSANDGTDAFLAKLDNAGNVRWIHLFGGPGLQQANGVAVDPAGNVYVGGIVEVATQSNTGFLAKYDSAGNQSWIEQLSPDSSDVRGVGVDAAGNVWVAGNSSVPLPGEPTPVRSNAFAFVAKFDTAGTRLWVERVDLAETTAEAVTVDAGGNAYVTGKTADDGFVAKVDSNGNLK